MLSSHHNGQLLSNGWINRNQSLVFVGFGSEYKMPPERIHELAIGLELSKLPFLWGLQEPEGVDSSELLPPGFSTRTSDQGVISLGWPPQLEMLAHSAIGGCIFHSGWGSIIESLGFGHPPILMPMVADQGLNARLLVEKGIGYEVPRNEDGSFTGDAVAKSIRLLMLEQERAPIRVKAATPQTAFANQDLHDIYINKFINYSVNFEQNERHSPLQVNFSVYQPEEPCDSSASTVKTRIVAVY
ncbi:UDP-glycosyltransferase 91C1-like [Diospyros lotus]|uniref:UDP-glycosyltransferase 91C1-like n=1 Tax=Diospyros lotus TaxID=55363 RepID=UPI00224FDE2D|nr:UDP-glycosyltransferase 91C1-like [Diospyros lotus]